MTGWRDVVVAAAMLGAISFASTPFAAEVSFESDLMPTLKRRCGACHITGEEPGKMALIPGQAYAALVNQPSVEAEGMLRVTPGDPGQSYLIHKLEGTHADVGGSGARMPFHQGPLPAKQILQFRDWISAGAPDN